MFKNNKAKKETENIYIHNKIKNFKYTPLISVLMPVYNVDTHYLKKAIESVIRQVYRNWELVIVDDASTDSEIKVCLDKYADKHQNIKVIHRETNGGISIASNDAINISSGEFIAFLDNDDELTSDALFENVLVLNDNPSLDMIYSDEDRISLGNQLVDPFFKPDFDKFWLLSNMYMGHLIVYRKKIFEEIGLFRKEFDGSQDWDLALRVIDKTDNIYHIQKILYHWRKIQGSTALSSTNKNWAYEAGKRAVKDYFNTHHIDAEISDTRIPGIIEYKMKLQSNPKVSIIIPTKNKLLLLSECIKSIEEKSTYKNYEIIIVNNNSTEDDILEYFKTTKHKVFNYDKEFNFADINNQAVSVADGDYLLFLNNDTKVITEDWLEKMLSYAIMEDVGAVGVKLFYPSRKIQHAGVGLFFYGPADLFSGRNYDELGYFSVLSITRTILAVTGACLMVNKSKFQEVGMFDINFPNDFQDIDLCLKLHEKGYKNVFNANVYLYHFESETRGKNLSSFNIAKWHDFVNKWSKYINYDPYNQFMTKAYELTNNKWKRKIKKIIKPLKTKLTEK